MNPTKSEGWMTSMVPYPIIYLFHVGLRRNMSECEVKEKSETYVIAMANVPHLIPLHRTAARVNLTWKPFLSLPMHYNCHHVKTSCSKSQHGNLLKALVATLPNTQCHVTFSWYCNSITFDGAYKSGNEAQSKLCVVVFCDRNVFLHKWCRLIGLVMRIVKFIRCGHT